MFLNFVTMSTSFKRAAGTALPHSLNNTIEGQNTALQNNNKAPSFKKEKSLSLTKALHSTGIPSFDSLLLSGGLPTGSLMVLYKDENSHFSKLLKNLFLAAGLYEAGEGLVWNAEVGVDASFSCGEVDPLSPEVKLERADNLWKELPGKKETMIHRATSNLSAPITTSSQPRSTNDLTIAWRYHALPTLMSSDSSHPSMTSVSSAFDLNTRLSIQSPQLRSRIITRHFPVCLRSLDSFAKSAVIAAILTCIENLPDDSRVVLEFYFLERELYVFLTRLKLLIQSKDICALLLFPNPSSYQESDKISSAFNYTSDFVFSLYPHSPSTSNGHSGSRSQLAIEGLLKVNRPLLKGLSNSPSFASSLSSATITTLWQMIQEKRQLYIQPYTEPIAAPNSRATGSSCSSSTAAHSTASTTTNELF